MKKNHSRTPNSKIQRILRSEVHFGCPVKYQDGSGCGSPILTFHHFDPPWAGNYTHNPDGMIALCPAHHRQADGGLWTKQQLREMKKNPYIDDTIKVQWPWTPENIVIKFGRSLVIGGGSPLKLFGKPIFQFSPVTIPGFGLKQISFESHIHDESKNLWLSIHNNIFEIDLLNTTDLIFTPHTKSIIAKCSDKTFIDVNYKKYSLEQFMDNAKLFMQNGKAFQTLGQSLEKSGSIDSDGNINLVDITGHFRTPDVEIKLLCGEMYVQTFIPGLLEEIKFHSWVVSKKNHLSFRLTNERNREFLRLG